MQRDIPEVQKVRHPIRARMLQVKRITELNDWMRRITLTGPDLNDFLSASFDDHVKLLLPAATGARPHVPAVGPNGLIFDDNLPRPVMRDYTPRRHDAAAQELDIDFVLHHAGPATDWARDAQPGHFLGIAGPRGSFVIPMEFDWHLLVGDETAIPAIARRLEELPATTTAIAVIQARSGGERLALAGPCEHEVRWVAADGEAGGLVDAVRGMTLPPGEGYAWAAGEYADIQAVRQYLIGERGMDKSRIRAASYWRKSTPNTHEQFD